MRIVLHVRAVVRVIAEYIGEHFGEYVERTRTHTGEQIGEWIALLNKHNYEQILMISCTRVLHKLITKIKAMEGFQNI
jgi:hypothetical protein